MYSFTNLSRKQLLKVVGWSENDLDNRVFADQLALAFECRVPTSQGTYVGADTFALMLTDALVQAGLPRALAARCVLEGSQKWLAGLARLEWPEAYPPPVAAQLGPTKRGLDEGIAATVDANIYFAVARGVDGTSPTTACGTLIEIVTALVETIRTAPAGAPANIIQVNLQQVREATLAAAEKAEVDLGAPFTRPEGHTEYLDWYAGIAAHRATSIQRGKSRKPPGPRAKSRAQVKIGKPRSTRARRNDWISR